MGIYYMWLFIWCFAGIDAVVSHANHFIVSSSICLFIYMGWMVFCLLLRDRIYCILYLRNFKDFAMLRQ